MQLHTAEFISRGHPDKVADAISDGVLDALLDIAQSLGSPPTGVRAAVETMVKGNLVICAGEVNGPKSVLAELDLQRVVERVWTDVGYAHQGTPTAINHIQAQSAEIAAMVDASGIATGAGDQGIMCGYAYRNAGKEYLPPEFDLARRLIRRLDEKRLNGSIPQLRSDAKSQVTVDTLGNITSLIVSTQHDESISLEQLRERVFDEVVVAEVGQIDPDVCKINHRGSFVLGGSAADCGVTGRKIVCDAYGPRAPVGGGAFSGKDPSKVDRSAAYMARAIARRLLQEHPAATEAHVQLGYGIGQEQPSSVLGLLDGRQDVSAYIRDTFPDLSPFRIQERLGLWSRNGWRYGDTASMGHFGRTEFPWEQF